MLVGVQNIAAVPVDEVGNGRDLALAVGAGNQQDGGILHGSRPCYFFNSFNISRAAFAPDPPVNPAPGCVPLPHKYRF